MSNEAIAQTDIARLTDRDSSAALPYPICRRAHTRSNVHVGTVLANEQGYSLGGLDPDFREKFLWLSDRIHALICDQPYVKSGWTRLEGRRQ
jgi:hypothetical protein